ncbi:MAG: hypothetical protein U9Q69_01955 [Nanoarchaeota archaeon]|nr:hypothetical protein [Nanoarchaeota archaeon]
MASVTFAIPKDVKLGIKELSWVNWSEAAREELVSDIKRSKALQKLDELFKDSKITDEDCLMLGRQLKKDMRKRLKKEGKL